MVKQRRETRRAWLTSALMLTSWSLLSLTARGGDAAASPSADAVEFFEAHIRPVLAERCYKCHSAQAAELKGGLRLDLAAGVRRGGETGPVVIPGRPADSLLISALRYQSLEMPPDGKLPDEVISDFERWVAAGAPDPRGEGEPGTPAPPSMVKSSKHWSFVPPVKPAPPPTDSKWPRTEIDKFVLARLAKAGLSPSDDADRRTLLRRLSYDLVGLPPTAEDLDAFATQVGDGAYAAAVDQILDSPRFGERWGRYWLDVARYADTKGYLFEEDRNYPMAYKYRDWVIGAFNGDMPFDRFVVSQLAGDQLSDPTAAPASGFLTLGRRFLNNPHDIVDDRIDLVTRGLMGLTVACARCHDHKYDPVPTADYYSLYGVFASSDEQTPSDNPPALADLDKPREDPVIFLRGNPASPGVRVPRHFVSCLSGGEPTPFVRGSGRMELADAIASRDNPLTARVWVNRVWGHLFGRPLVATPSDFGARGQPPTHPELLDWLAVTFMDEGWSTKKLIRRIVMSSVYRQASFSQPEGEQVDSENSLLWRMNRRRLDLEAFRDSLLSAAGTLDETMAGPSVQLTEPQLARRRAVYGFIERQNPPAFFRTFDFANPNSTVAMRPQTASPHQALFMLNSPLVLQQACALAERSMRDVEDAGGADPMPDDARIARLYRFALGRDPTASECDGARAYLAQAAADREQIAADAKSPSGLNPWEELAHVLLMSNEFMFVD